MPCCTCAHTAHSLIASSPWRLRKTSAGGKLSDHVPSHDGRGCRGLDGCHSGRCPSATGRRHKRETCERHTHRTYHHTLHYITHHIHHTSHARGQRKGKVRATCQGQRKSRERTEREAGSCHRLQRSMCIARRKSSKPTLQAKSCRRTGR